MRVSFLALISCLACSWTPVVYADQNLFWVSAAKEEAEKEVLQWERALAQAQDAEVWAQEALKKAHKANDEKAMSVALQALDTAKRAKPAAETLIQAARLRLERLIAVLSLVLPKDKTFAVPTLARGKIERKSGEGWEPFDPSRPLMDGDTVQTGPDGRLEIILESGQRVELGPHTAYTYRKEPQGLLHRLFKGRLLFKRPAFQDTPPSVPVRGENIRVQGMTAIAAVRGTEFELGQDEAGFTHLRPVAGKIELAAGPGGEPRKLTRWWEEGRPTASSPLPAGKLLRVDFVRGVAVLESGGSRRPARVGELLAAKDVLSTGKDGLAQLGFADGGKIALGPESRLEALTQGERTRSVFALWRGLLHLDVGESPPLLMTPNAVADLRGAELVASVDENGLADYLPLAGSLEIAAKREKLDMDKLRPWWREPW